MTAGRSDILYVMAVDLEYGPHLRRRITPLMTGVGPVEAAIAVTAALGEAQAESRLPALVVSLGSAGSRTLRQTEIYQARSVAYRDMDATAIGFPRGETPFLKLPAVLPLAPLVAGLSVATLSTGANIVSGAAYDTIEADMVDMETYAVKRACERYRVPLIALRGISDGAEELSGRESWTRYLHLVDEKLAIAVDRVEAAFASGLLDLS
jgi:adenosylhomocysteine nucleosidase